MSPALAQLRRRFFWVEAVLATLATLMLVITLLWHDWLEAFGFDPDHGDGSAERLIVALLLVAAVVFGVVARFEWRRTATARRPHPA